MFLCPAIHQAVQQALRGRGEGLDGQKEERRDDGLKNAGRGESELQSEIRKTNVDRNATTTTNCFISNFLLSLLVLF